MKKLVLVVFLVLFISGCGTFYQGYRHPGTGRESACRVMGWGWIGFPVAVLEFGRCKGEYERAGYEPVGEEKR